MNAKFKGARPSRLGAVFFRVDRILAMATATGMAICALLVLVMIAVVGHSITMRYIVGVPQVWSDELVGYLLVFCVLLGSAQVLREGGHVEVDILTDLLSPRAKRWAKAWGLLVTSIVAAVMILGGWELTVFSWQVGNYSTGYMEMPLWIPQASIPVGGLLLLLTVISLLIRLLLGEGEGGE